MTFSFENCFYLDSELYIWIIQVKRAGAKHNPMLLIVLLQSFSVTTEIYSRCTPVGIEGLKFFMTIILSAMTIYRDLPVIKLFVEGVFLDFIVKHGYLSIPEILYYLAKNVTIPVNKHTPIMY